jgi:membrane-associated phospholipid phosphatase
MNRAELAEPLVGAESRVAGDVTRLRPVDWYVVVYLGIAIVLMLANPNRDAQIGLLAGLHAVGIAVLVTARRLGLANYRVGGLLLDFYPLVLFPFLYIEVGVVDGILHPGIFGDDVIQRWEDALFGSQLSQTLHLKFPSRLLGEYLHVGYSSYYFLGPALAFTLWFTRPRVQFERAIGTVGLSFCISFVIFILYPVAGPYHAFTPPDAEAVGYLMPHVTRGILDRGSAVGAAFPSSHMAVALTLWIMAMRYHKGLAVLYLCLVPALGMGAIYGGYHYAIDIVAGAVLGLLVGTVGFRLTKAISNTRDAA